MKQVSNWFTNVRKRIWQPLRRKGKSKDKDIEELMLKVKLRLESEGAQSNRSRSPDLIEKQMD